MKNQNISKKILYWYDNNQRSLPWRSYTTAKKKEYYTLVSEFMLQQTQVVTVIPFFKKFLKHIPNLKSLAKANDKKLIKLWEGLGYYTRVRNLKKTSKIIVQKYNGRIPNNFENLKSLPGIGNYTANAILAIAFNKPFIPLDGNIERLLKRYLYLKKDNEVSKANLELKKKIFGKSKRSSDYAQALMELGALVCKPNNPECAQCPISKNCLSFKKDDFSLTKMIKKKVNKYFILKVYKKDKKYLLIKNTKFKFLKNFKIFPMQELLRPKNFNENINLKMSNMNMNIQIQYSKGDVKLPYSFWIEKGKMNKYMLPTFTKKIVKYLESN